MAQATGLTLLHRYSALTSSTHPGCGSKAQLSLVAFAYAGHSKSVAQLSFIIGIVAGPIQRGSIFQLLSSSSHKSRRPVCFTAAAEILAAGEALEEVLLLKNALEHMYGTTLLLTILVDTEDL